MTTPQEILAELRDIHLPEITEANAPLVLDPRPFMVLALLVLVVASVRYIRATQWRRQARRRLRELSGNEDPIATRAALTALLHGLPHRTRLSALPDGVFRPDNTTNSDDIAALRQQVKAALRGRVS